MKRYVVSLLFVVVSILIARTSAANTYSGRVDRIDYVGFRDTYVPSIVISDSYRVLDESDIVNGAEFFLLNPKTSNL